MAVQSALILSVKNLGVLTKRIGLAVWIVATRCCIYLARVVTNRRVWRASGALGIWALIGFLCLVAVAKVMGLEGHEETRRLAMNVRVTCMKEAEHSQVALQSIVFSPYPAVVAKIQNTSERDVRQRDFDERLLDGNASPMTSDSDLKDAVLKVSVAPLGKAEDQTKCQSRLIVSSEREIAQFSDEKKNPIVFVQGATGQVNPDENPLDNFLDSNEPYENVYSTAFDPVNSKPIFITFTKPLRASKGYGSIVWEQILSAESDQPGSEAHFLVANAVEYAGRFDEQRLSPGAEPLTPVRINAADLRHRIATFVTEFDDSRDKHPFVSSEPSPDHVASIMLHANDPEVKDYCDFFLFGLAAVFGAAIGAIVEEIISLFRQ